MDQLIFLIIITITIILLIRGKKEGLKRKKRTGVSNGWKRSSSSAKNIALTGSRYTYLPKLYYNRNYNNNNDNN